MPRKGQVNNPNGRPKGSLNKKTILFRAEAFEKVSKKYLKAIDRIDELDLKDQLTQYPKILSYAVPRYNTVDALKEMQEERQQKELYDNIVGEAVNEVLTDEQVKIVNAKVMERVAQLQQSGHLKT